MIVDTTSTTMKPNFFILGAPKCGTTSLATWLSEHPDIYLSPTKEPHFFNTDHKRSIYSLQSYERLFARADKRHRAVGEASVWYLCSTVAVKNILDYNADARFIVMLRNPVDMAPSLHDEQVFTGREDVNDFTEAWSLQDARRQGHRLPTMVSEPQYLQYGDVCCLGKQVARLLEIVSAARVKFILLEDVERDPAATYRSVLQFLNVGDNHYPEFQVHNRAKMRRWRGLNTVAWAVSNARAALGIERGLGLWQRIDAINHVERARRPLSDDLRRTLRDYFTADVTLLQSLIGRDLRHWCT
jgi:Sulfotransferase domain